MFHPGATDRVIEGSYAQVFQATLEVLEERDFPIKEVNREEGQIETGKRPVEGVDPYHPVETVQAYIEEDGEVSVRLLMTFLEPRPSNPPRDPREKGERRSSKATKQVLSKSAMYYEYLDTIAERVWALQNGGES